MANIMVINEKKEYIPKRKRVAAYARVSVESNKPLNSLQNQVGYSKNLIKFNPSYKFVGVYTDEEITGTGIDKRKGFLQMMKDSRNGKIDMIYVKSISRFARNTVDLLGLVRELKNLGISVFFEKENINSLDADGEFMITLLASFAEEEARNISENIKWSIRKKFKAGIQNGAKAPYGYLWNGKKYITIPSEERIVKQIFSRYLQGDSAYRICKDLKNDNVIGRYGGPISESSIKYILSNPAYIGDKILQKTYTTFGKRQINNVELIKYIVSDMYEPIISKDIFEKAQEIRKINANVPSTIYKPTVFSRLAKCGHCGCGVSRRTAKGEKVWKCNRKERKGTCDLNHITEDELRTLSCRALRMNTFDDEIFKSKVKQITLRNNRLDFLLKNDSLKKIKRDYGAYKKKSGFSGKLVCGCCGNKYVSDTWKIGKKGAKKKIKVWNCKTPKSKCHNHRVLDEILRKLVKQIFDNKQDYEGLFATHIDKAVIYENYIEFRFKKGRTQIWYLE